MRQLNLFSQASRSIICLIVLSSLAITGCGGGESAVHTPTISINEPTTSSSYSTTQTSIRLGGVISIAGIVRVLNSSTGSTTDGYVIYDNQNHGSWFADVYGLGFGDNLITVTAYADGRTTSAKITITRPLRPAELIINGPNLSSAGTHWTCASSFGGSHEISLFEDGTGRSTSGSTTSEVAGTVADFTWSYSSSPDSIIITNCSNCSFQKISRIQGSLSERFFYGQIDTVGGAGNSTLDYFELTDSIL